MPVREHYASGAPCWIDRVSPSLAGIQPFYTTLFGWDYVTEGAYKQARLAGRTVAGFGTAPVDLWNVYLASKNLEESAERVTQLGGRVVMPPVTLGETGQLFLALDPAGAPVGFWQGFSEAGIVLADEICASCRYELIVRERARVAAFYDVIGPDITIREEQTKPYWRISFGVADVAVSAYAAVTAGARGIMQLADGSVTVVDPGGARFGLVACP